MTEKEILIFDMIEEGISLNEMAYYLKLSPRQVHQKIQKLTSEGYFISPIYYNDGEIKYCFDKPMGTKHTLNLSIDGSNKFKALVIADMHLGNSLENLGYLYKAYDYARDNNIHVILNCGDLIDGNFTRGKQIISNVDEQIERVIKYYPHDKNILNFICYGNHDYSAYACGRDIAVALSKNRPDLISGGYGFSLINVLRDQFVMSHPLNNINFKPMPNKVILEGHHHKAMFKIERNNYIVSVPPLSDLCFGEANNPGMIDMKLTFCSGFIHIGHFKLVDLKDRPVVYNEMFIEFFLKHKNLDEKNLIIK